MLFNSIAQAVFKTGSSLLADALMSTHAHLIVVCESPSKLVMRVRSSYTQMFNHRYLRTGPLGEESFYSVELKGRRHIAAAVSYVVRNSCHHEVCANVYSYPFTSVGQYFRNNIGNFAPAADVIRGKRRSDIIRTKNRLPDGVEVMRSTGMISYDDVIDNVLVEGYFGSYRSFMYGLNRNDYDRWMHEHEADDNGLAPVTLGTVEPFLSEEKVRSILQQNLYWVKEKSLSDIELCDIIDHHYVPMYGKLSYTQFTNSEAEVVRSRLARDFHVARKQLERCLPCR